MKVLVTGGGGRIGHYLVSRLLNEGYEVNSFNRLTDKTKERSSGWQGKAKVFRGDIRNFEQVKEAVSGVDAVIHLTFLVDPYLDKRAEEGEEINVGGTRNLIRAMKEEGKDIKLVFSSSVIVFGPTMHEQPPIPPDYPTRATNNYSRHKLECERMIRDSGLKHVILRLSFVPHIEVDIDDMEIVYQIPPHNRIEPVHVQDLCTACINALRAEEAEGKTFIIAGGKKCQYIYKDMLAKMFLPFGMPELDWSEVTSEPYPLDWYDTSEAQRILKFQERDIDDYIEDLLS